MTKKIDNSNIDNKDNIRSSFWKKEDEEILKEWSDKAQCYEWMHNKGHQYYKNKSIWYTIPVIIISTITGTANFAQDRFGNENVKNYVVMGIGSLSIIAGIITTVSQFLKINELNEGHRVATLSWGKFNRNIKTELTKHPLDRKSPDLIIKVSKDEFDRLIEVSPSIPKNIIALFNNLYGKDDSFIKPDICGHTFGTHIYTISDTERDNIFNNMINKKEISIKNIKDVEQDNKINQFKETYYNLNNRYPTEEEIKMIFQPIIDNTYNDNNNNNKKFKMTIKPRFSSRKYSNLDINTDSDNSDNSSNNDNSDNSGNTRITRSKSRKNSKTLSTSTINENINENINETIILNNSDNDSENTNNDDYEYDNKYLNLNHDEDNNSNNTDIIV